jgi:glutamyl-tRNA reductase
MKLHLVGCSHHQSPLQVRERLAFSPAQAHEALRQLRQRFPQAEAVLLSTCNRVELYTAVDDGASPPSPDELAGFLADFHCVPLDEVLDELFQRQGEDAVRHLFAVAASLDSMVVGEAQIGAQVRQAFLLAQEEQCTGPLTKFVFDGALRAARRVAAETQVNQRRVSIPSVAVDFARQIFERFDDKQVLVVGAGEMAAETLRYLRDAGAARLSVVNRSLPRAEELARQWQGRALPWEELPRALAESDLVIATTGAAQPVVDLPLYRRVEEARQQRPLCVLDLAVPRDFDPAIAEAGLNVYLYSLDDLEGECRRNRALRERELPQALQIIEEETAAFMADLHHRATGPLIARLKQDWERLKDDELRRLLNRLPGASDAERDEIRRAFDRLVNKFLHPPLESLRQESRHGTPHGLLDALRRLFRLDD